MELSTLDINSLGIGALAGLFVGWFLTWLGTRSSVRKLQSRIAEISTRREFLERQSADMQDQLLALRTNIDAAERELTAEREVVAALRSQSSADRSAQSDDEGRFQAQEHALDTLRSQLSLKQDELESLQAELSMLRMTHMQPAEPAPEETELITQAQEEIAEEDDSGTEAEIDPDIDREIDPEANSEMETLLGEVSQLQDELHALSGLNAQLERRLQSSRAEVAGEMALLTTTMLQLKDEALRKAREQIQTLSEGRSPQSAENRHHA